MKMRPQPRNLAEFYQQHNYRAMLVAIFCIVLILGLSIRMYYMQVIQYVEFNKKANNNYTQNKFIQPIRGNIYDRNGKILAGNNVVYNLGIVIENIKDKKLTKLLTQIGKLIPISQDDLVKFKSNRRLTRAHDPVILRSRLSEVELAKIEVNLYNLDGVVIIAQYDRFYTYPKEFAHIIGHIGVINQKEFTMMHNKNYRHTSRVGKIGIEKQYEKILHGKAGNIKIENDAQGRMLKILSVDQAEAGADIYLNIDARLQTLAFEAMGNYRGSVVAIDPNNFEVLAMVSTPSYDANLFINGISYKDYNFLKNNINKPLFNRSISGRYPAGSIFKPFLALAGLESNTINRKQKILCKGHYQLKNSNHKFRDWKKEGHGLVDINHAIAESCDVFFFDLALKLGIDKIHPYLGLFGFGKKTGVDLPYEINGFIPSREWKKKRRDPIWHQGETLNVGVGQGKVQVTPLQIAQAVAILANGGKYHAPKILNHQQKITGLGDNNQAIIFKSIPIEDKRNWDMVIKGMGSVVNSDYGTARRIVSKRYKIAGKTGTAQVVTIAQDLDYDESKLNERQYDHALFMAFAPIKNPKIAIAVVVENGKHGGSTAAPIAKKIIDKYLLSILTRQQLNAENSSTQLKKPLLTDIKKPLQSNKLKEKE